MDRFGLLPERYAQLLLVAAYLAGAVMAIVFWSRHPRQSLLVLIAVALSLAVEFFFIARWFYFENDEELESLYSTVDLVVRTIAFSLLLFAVFGGPRRPTRTFADDDYNDFS